MTLFYVFMYVCMHVCVYLREREHKLAVVAGVGRGSEGQKERPSSRLPVQCEVLRRAPSQGPEIMT